MPLYYFLHKIPFLNDEPQFFAMIFENPILSTLSKNTTQITTTYYQNTTHLAQYVDILKPIYATSLKKILISEEHKQTLTEIGKIVLEALPLKNSTQIILKEILRKIDNLGDGSTGLILFCAILSRNLLGVVSKGVGRRQISNSLKVIRRNISKIEVDKVELTFEDILDARNFDKIASAIVKTKYLRDLVVEACANVFKNVQKKDFEKVLSEIDDRLRVVKVYSGLDSESQLFKGLVYKNVAKTIVKEVETQRTSIYSCPIEISQTTSKGIVMFQTADELLSFSTEEEKNIKQTVEQLTKHSNVVVCSGKVENLFLQYFDEKNVLVFNLNSKHDIRRIRNLFTGSVSPVLKELNIENCGYCDFVKVLQFGNEKFTWFSNEKQNVATILLKNSIPQIADESERLILKAMKAIEKNYINGKYTLVQGCGYFERKVASKLSEMPYEDEEPIYFDLVVEAFKKSLAELVCDIPSAENVYDLLNVRLKVLQYAIDICCTILETDDHFAVRDAMNLGQRPDMARDID
ncbi:hypothetical protein EDEG_02528 [Edhazardia aedis USNM 41457]|uniref:Uncharacterized protein n=1 Tax=Edhazardia aedis (strain USNM 41457) TaxID=1003232 RepID=J9DKH9_EDHAE|nr:hypothetical protein EDEG_02528 [Edhazardia aedis USNM 41457]|eukprot:EJW03090.1 hypothetical protein EDEG_02528 [Edhazardia aedis USNM 41457]